MEKMASQLSIIEGEVVVYLMGNTQTLQYTCVSEYEFTHTSNCKTISNNLQYAMI